MSKFMRSAEDVLCFILKLLPFFLVVPYCLSINNTISLDTCLAFIGDFYSLSADIIGVSAIDSLFTYLGFTTGSAFTTYVICPLLYCVYVDIAKLFINFVFMIFTWCSNKVAQKLGVKND